MELSSAIRVSEGVFYEILDCALGCSPVSSYAGVKRLLGCSTEQLDTIIHDIALGCAGETFCVAQNPCEGAI